MWQENTMRWKKKWKILKFIYYINMVDISRKMDGKNGVEKIVDRDGIFWLNEHIEENMKKD